jgi:hypothetical protein
MQNVRVARFDFDETTPRTSAEMVHGFLQTEDCTLICLQSTVPDECIVHASSRSSCNHMDT